jgi:hypothetical protein
MTWLDIDASYKECHVAIITNFKPHYRTREQFESTAVYAPMQRNTSWWANANYAPA